MQRRIKRIYPVVVGGRPEYMQHLEVLRLYHKSLYDTAKERFKKALELRHGQKVSPKWAAELNVILKEASEHKVIVDMLQDWISKGNLDAV